MLDHCREVSRFYAITGAIPRMLAFLLGICASAAGAPAMEGRDLHALADPAIEGNGPGGALFVEARDLGAEESSLGGVAMAGWTLRPVRIAVALPGEAGTEHVTGLPPRIDALFVLADRRRALLGVAAALDLPLPFFPGDDRPADGRISLGIGEKHTAFVVNLGAPIGRELSAIRWQLGFAAPLVSVLSGFAELEGSVPVDVERPQVGTPDVATLRLGLHLSPVRPIVVGFAVEGHPDDVHPAFAGSVAWIPQPREKRAAPKRLARRPDAEAVSRRGTLDPSPPSDTAR